MILSITEISYKNILDVILPEINVGFLTIPPVASMLIVGVLVAFEYVRYRLISVVDQ